MEAKAKAGVEEKARLEALAAAKAAKEKEAAATENTDKKE